MTTVSPAADTTTINLPRANVVTLDDEPAPVVEPSQAEQLAAALRDMANMVAAHPELVTEYRFAHRFDRFLVPVTSRAAVAAWARAGLAANAKITKYQDEIYAGIDVQLGRASLHVYVEREELCERVVTGVREVTEEVPDPEALAAVPKVAVTKTVEDVEWVCRPILAGGDL